MQIKQAGSYLITAVVAAVSPSSLAVEVDGQTLEAEVPVTGDWTDKRPIEMGKVEFKKSGVHDLVLRPAKPGSWKAVNVWKLELRLVN